MMSHPWKIFNLANIDLWIKGLLLKVGVFYQASHYSRYFAYILCDFSLTRLYLTSGLKRLLLQLFRWVLFWQF